MATPDTLRYTRIPLNNGAGAIPAVGFGTLIPDPAATKEATKTALEVGFRHFDCADGPNSGIRLLPRVLDVKAHV
jgi:hypothetical protein